MQWSSLDWITFTTWLKRDVMLALGWRTSSRRRMWSHGEVWSVGGSVGDGGGARVGGGDIGVLNLVGGGVRSAIVACTVAFTCWSWVTPACAVASRRASTVASRSGGGCCFAGLRATAVKTPIRARNRVKVVMGSRVGELMCMLSVPPENNGWLVISGWRR